MCQPDVGVLPKFRFSVYSTTCGLPTIGKGSLRTVILQHSLSKLAVGPSKISQFIKFSCREAMRQILSLSGGEYHAWWNTHPPRRALADTQRFALCPPLIFRNKVLIQTKKYSQDQVREVRTREDGGSNKLNPPLIVAVKVGWEPDDSCHQGKLFMASTVTGGPQYVEFGPCRDGDGNEKEPKWKGEVRSVWQGLQRQFKCSASFTPEREGEWKAFMAAYPWGGLSSLHPNLLPAFVIPPFRVLSREAAETSHLLDQCGEDPYGRWRYRFSRGQDTADYRHVPSNVTFNGLLCGMNGKMMERKRHTTGESYR